MKALKILVLILLILATGQATFSQTEQKRIDRLAGLAHVWGTVKFFHPYLAYRKIDWDKALVDAIPKVNAATTPAEYQAAVNSMLSTLEDSATLAEIPVQPSKLPVSPSVAASAAHAVTLTDGVLSINLLDAGRAVSSDGSQYEKLPKQIGDLLPHAKAVVIDCRAPHASNAFADITDWTEVFLEQVLSTLVVGNKPLSTFRFRTHNGYASQTNEPSGGYTSALVTNIPNVLAGTAQTQLPITFIVNDDSLDVAVYAEGLRAAGIAKVITEGPLTMRPGANPFTIKLPDGVVVKAATRELLNLDGTTGFVTDASFPANSDGELKRVLASFTGPSLPAKMPNTSSSSLTPVDQKDNSYPDMRLPSKEYRLLALFRFWSVIETFFPYHDLLDESWTTVLQRYIPRFEATASAADYQMTVCQLLTETHDSHGYVAGKKELDEKLGTFVAPLYVRYVHDEAVIVRSYDDKLAVRRGDVILAIDGRPEKEVRNEIARRIPSSTPQALLWVTGFHLLRGKKDSVVKLTLRDVDGQTRTVDVTSSLDRNDQNVDGAQDSDLPRR